MRRRVRYKCKERKTPTRINLAAREFRINRTYDDFKELIKKAPETSVVELDTVEGGCGNSEQAFLTMLFRNCSLMLIFVLKEKTQDCVFEIFDTLSEKPEIGTFKKLFPVAQ